MKSFVNSSKFKSKNTKIVSSLFLALTLQLSIMVMGLSHSSSPFVLSQTFPYAEAQVDEAFKTYENPKFGLTVSYPPTWSVVELRKDPAAPSNNSFVAIFNSPAQGENDQFAENVIINVQGPRSDVASLEQYTENSLTAFRNMSDTIKIVKSGKDTLGGLPAQQLIYTSTGMEGVNQKKMQVFAVVNNNTAYVVTFAAEESQYDKSVPDFEKMVNSIKIDREAMKNVQENQNQPTKTSGKAPTVLIDGKSYSGT